MDVRLSLSIDDLVLLIEALDCYEYWELGRLLPRNNGAVLISGDHLGGVDLQRSRRLSARLQDLIPDAYWSAPSTDEQAEAIEVVQTRELGAPQLSQTERYNPGCGEKPGALTASGLPVAAAG